MDALCQLVVSPPWGIPCAGWQGPWLMTETYLAFPGPASLTAEAQPVPIGSLPA